MCPDCKAHWGKFVIFDIGQYKINWIELNRVLPLVVRPNAQRAYVFVILCPLVLSCFGPVNQHLPLSSLRMPVVSSGFLQAQRQPTDAKESGRHRTYNNNNSSSGNKFERRENESAHRNHSITSVNNVKEGAVCFYLHQRERWRRAKHIRDKRDKRKLVAVPTEGRGFQCFSALNHTTPPPPPSRAGMTKRIRHESQADQTEEK